MADLFENPMGLMGFEFVEFATPTPNTIEPVLELLGFTLVPFVHFSGFVVAGGHALFQRTDLAGL